MWQGRGSDILKRMREIEIKVRLGNTDAIVSRLENDGYQMSDPVTQLDQVFGQIGVDARNNKAPWLRIRTETKGESSRILYTLKKSADASELDSLEFETEVTDAKELEQIILHSGFEPFTELTKTRRKTKVGDIEICIDQVDKLGYFVEAEKLTVDDADHDLVTQELWELLEKFGLSKADEVVDGYDTMIKELKVY